MEYCKFTGMKYLCILNDKNRKLLLLMFSAGMKIIINM